MATLQLRELPLPVDIIFSCAICQATISEIYRNVPDTDLQDISTTKLWLTACAHLVCAKHLGKDPSKHEAGGLPKAPCPICSKERGDIQEKTLYDIQGWLPGLYNDHIPSNWFDIPPIRLDGHGSGMEAMRFHYISLVRFGINIFSKYQESRQNVEELEAKVEKELNLSREAEQHLERLQARVSHLEKCEKELQPWKDREPRIKYYLGVFVQMTRENERLRQQLTAMGYAVPIIKYGLDPPPDGTKQMETTSSEKTQLASDKATMRGRHSPLRTSTHHEQERHGSSASRTLSGPSAINTFNQQRPTEIDLTSPPAKKRNHEEMENPLGGIHDEIRGRGETWSRGEMPPPAVPVSQRRDEEASIYSRTLRQQQQAPTSTIRPDVDSRILLGEQLLSRNVDAILQSESQKETRPGDDPLIYKHDFKEYRNSNRQSNKEISGKSRGQALAGMSGSQHHDLDVAPFRDGNVPVENFGIAPLRRSNHVSSIESTSHVNRNIQSPYKFASARIPISSPIRRQPTLRTPMRDQREYEKSYPGSRNLQDQDQRPFIPLSRHQSMLSSPARQPFKQPQFLPKTPSPLKASSLLNTPRQEPVSSPFFTRTNAVPYSGPIRLADRLKPKSPSVLPSRLQSTSKLSSIRSSLSIPHISLMTPTNSNRPTSYNNFGRTTQLNSISRSPPKSQHLMTSNSLRNAEGLFQRPGILSSRPVSPSRLLGGQELFTPSMRRYTDTVTGGRPMPAPPHDRSYALNSTMHNRGMQSPMRPSDAAVMGRGVYERQQNRQEDTRPVELADLLLSEDEVRQMPAMGSRWRASN